jgi:hypothetical protein
MNVTCSAHENPHAPDMDKERVKQHAALICADGRRYGEHLQEISARFPKYA